MPDHEVHEIQLNGKQLVFMFMAATVVSVVIFLCGVMVGRGVRQPQADFVAASAADSATPVESSPPSLPADSPAPVDDAPVQDTLTYAEHLEASVAPDEPLKPAEPKPKAAPIVVAKPAPPNVEKPAPAKTVAPAEVKEAVARPSVDDARPRPTAQKASVTTPASTGVSARFPEPAGKGFVVQVAVLPALPDAEALAGRLQSKGYRTFVALNETGPQGARFRVRIGKYPTRSEALAVSQKIQREERFKPWVP